jgi:predicted O-methyltransferase YrrM
VTYKTTNKFNLELVIPRTQENQILRRLNPAYIEKSEMSAAEREFLNSLILRYKPKKLLELGVSAGSSSIVMLNAIKNTSRGRGLYSVDYNTQWYHSAKLKTGYLVDDYPELKSSWKLYTGGLALDFMDKIGGNIDFALIDTLHANPGEILDFLMIWPYLKDKAIVVFHDVNLHTAGSAWSITNNLLMSAISGKKLIQGNFSSKDYNKNMYKQVAFPNIGAIQLDRSTRQHIFEIFNLLTIKWAYLPMEKDISKIIVFFNKHYDKFYINYLKAVFAYHKSVKDKEQKTIKYWLKEIVHRLGLW